MRPRLLHVIAAGVLQAMLGACVGFYFGGRGPAAIGAVVASCVSLSLSLRRCEVRRWAARQVKLAAVLIAISCAALYTFGDSGHVPWIGSGAQLLIALPLLIGCAALRMRIGRTPSYSAAMNEHDENTIELPVTSVADEDPSQGRNVSAPVWRRPWAAGVVVTALLVAATSYWLNDDVPRSALGGAIAREIAPVPAMPATVAPETADAEAVAPLIEEPPPPSPPPPTVQPPKDTGLAPSAARRECMAQIESARLFQQIARQASDREGYAAATAAQIERMLKARPVGPRTLSRIADRMWDARGVPERGAAWWSLQYSRCEEARISGTWYVVKG